MALTDQFYESVTHPPVAFEDERGRITNIINNPIQHVAVISSAPGAVRANHWHPYDVQRQFVIYGKVRAVSAPVDEAGVLLGSPRETVLMQGDLAECNPRIGHASSL